MAAVARESFAAAAHKGRVTVHEPFFQGDLLRDVVASGSTSLGWCFCTKVGMWWFQCTKDRTGGAKQRLAKH